ncbi:Uncharacterized conserved protein YlxW, UPF0749 family [Tindallia magadiensis]|uniref:Uncharacterized conserved protein YlxW, UPF0749 family n=1 Tax=Tindallia magadiensis TaxID=69895 RepID=A0A1I3FXA3_9FIRM|nr:DUF881 domain-containing protein [Tindallia magadiensis]SFI15870.1 Uncharacterized conserved protein YlxW, UPF0749 family [Tindallia magadiensis]
MKELKGKIAIGIICALLGLIVSMQIKSVREVAGGGFLSTQQAQKMASELRNLRTEKDQLTEELIDLENRLRDYEISEADENLMIKNLKNDLLRYQLLAGYIEGKGPGVMIEVSDPPSAFNQTESESFIMYNYEIILALINTLNAAGAEAISINEQRYVATTEVYYSNNALYINDVATSAPYTIKAIGNPETLEAALNMRYGIVWDMRNYDNLQVSVEKKQDITMPRYNRVYEFEYARPLEMIE